MSNAKKSAVNLRELAVHKKFKLTSSAYVAFSEDSSTADINQLANQFSPATGLGNSMKLNSRLQPF